MRKWVGDLEDGIEQEETEKKEDPPIELTGEIGSW